MTDLFLLFDCVEPPCGPQGHVGRARRWMRRPRGPPHLRPHHQRLWLRA